MTLATAADTSARAVIDQWLEHAGAGSAPGGAVAYAPLNGEPIGLTRKQYRELVNE